MALYIHDSDTEVYWLLKEQYNHVKILRLHGDFHSYFGMINGLLEKGYNHVVELPNEDALIDVLNLMRQNDFETIDLWTTAHWVEPDQDFSTRTIVIFKNLVDATAFRMLG